MCRRTEVSMAKVTMLSFFDNCADVNLKGTCTRARCEYWHPPKCQFNETETGCKAGDKCLFPHHKVDEQTKKSQRKATVSKKERKRRQECCGCCENCTTIGLRLPRLGSIGFSERNTVLVKPDATSLGTDSKNTIHSVYATSSKYLGKERTIAWENTNQKSSSAGSPRFEI